MSGREDWLHGAGRVDTYDTVVNGFVRCVGCGKGLGVITGAVVITEDHEPPPPDPEPAWPFEEEGCPVCAGRQARIDFLTETAWRRDPQTRAEHRGPLP